MKKTTTKAALDAARTVIILPPADEATEVRDA